MIYKIEVYQIIKKVLGIPLDHLLDCEIIKIPKRGGYMPSTPAKGLIQLLILMQIDYHKAKVRMNPNLYDRKGILTGYQFEEYDPIINRDDAYILGKLGIRLAHQLGGSGFRLEKHKPPQSFAEYMNNKLLEY